jgi:SAM-dependent methyltransferase
MSEPAGERPGLRFGRVAEQYERVRMEYPDALVDEVCARAGLGPGSRVLEIGSGTGKLTRRLVERGLAVEAVEPDPDLVEFAQGLLPPGSVTFHVSRFEAAELPQAAFEAAFAATSFHWVDPAVGWTKVAGALRPDGVFALLAPIAGLQGALERELVRVWKELAQTGSNWEPLDDGHLWAGAETRMGNISHLWSWLSRHELDSDEAGRLFHDVRLTRMPIEQSLTTAAYLARIRTTNAYLHLAPERQQALERGLGAAVERSGGTYRSTHFATLVSARRSSAPAAW